MSVNTEDAREKTSLAGENPVTEKKKLLPDEVGKELASITDSVKNATARLTQKKERSAALGEKTFWESAAYIAGLFKDAAADALKPRPKEGRRALKTPIFAAADDEELWEKEERAVKPVQPTEKKLAKAAQKARDSIKAGVATVLSEENREAGRAVAHSLGGGFGEAFKGVAEGARALRGAIEKKLPQSAPVFDVIGTVSGKAGELTGKALKATGRGIKAVGAGAGEKLREIKDSEVAANAGKKLSTAAKGALSRLAEGAKNAGTKLAEGTKNAGIKFAESAKNAGENLKKGAQSAGEKLTEIRGRTEERLAERRAAKESAPSQPSELSQKLKSFSEKTKERFETAKTAAAEKAHSFAEGARNKIESLREESDDESGEPSAAHEAAEKLKDFTGSFQSKAKDIVGKVRDKMEHFIADDGDESEK